MSGNGAPAERWLIVNADDFGATWTINRGVIEAHERGIVTSASLMIWGQAVPEAAWYARTHPELAVGLHVDLGEWVYRGRRWEKRYERVDLDDADSVRTEIQRQLAGFRALVGRDPTHLDSHQHVHNDEPVHSIVQQLCARLAIPMRAQPGIAHCGDFYGQDRVGKPLHRLVTPASLIGIIARLQPGVTELLCHPASGEVADSVYSSERSMELATLCDPRVAAALEDERVGLLSYAQVDAAGRVLDGGSS